MRRFTLCISYRIAGTQRVREAGFEPAKCSARSSRKAIRITEKP